MSLYWVLAEACIKPPTLIAMFSLGMRFTTNGNPGGMYHILRDIQGYHRCKVWQLGKALQYQGYPEMNQKIILQAGKTHMDVAKALYDEVQKSHGNWYK